MIPEQLVEYLAERLYLRAKGWPYPSGFWRTECEIYTAHVMGLSDEYGEAPEFREQARLAYEIITGKKLDHAADPP